MNTAERVAWWRRDPVMAAAALAGGWAYLALAVTPSLRWAGDPGGLPLAAWLLPIGAVIAPWVFGGGVRRGPRALLGTLGSLIAVGVMIFSPVLGAILALAWLVGLNTAAR
ncbi:hypothetical protein [Enemella dayhoffiae]|nr:hypothetical protein [Enemella dayhoffiae]